MQAAQTQREDNMDPHPDCGRFPAALLLIGFTLCSWSFAAKPDAAPASPASPSPISTAAETAKESPLFLVKVDGKWGYIDAAGKVVIQPRFDEAYGFSEGLACANIGGAWVPTKIEGGSTTVFQGGQWGFIDATGKFVIEMKAAEVKNFSEGLAAVKIGDKWGYIDRSGKMVIEPQFAIADSFSSERARVSLPAEGAKKPEDRPKFGYIDHTGRMVIPPKFYIAYDFSEGLAIAVANDPVAESWKADWGFIDPDGKFVIEPKYDWALPFSDGVAAVYTRDQRVEYVDRTGKTVCVVQGPAGKPLAAEGMGIPWRGHKEEAREFHEGLAPFRVGAHEVHRNFEGEAWRLHGFYYEGGKWGFIDKTGKVVIPPQFDGTMVFTEGLAAVVIRTETRTPNPNGGEDIRTISKWGYINPTGEMVIQPQFDSAGTFKNGLAQVTIEGDSWQDRKIGYIDKTGKYVWEPRK